MLNFPIVEAISRSLKATNDRVDSQPAAENAIEFLCDPRDTGVIAEPAPAKLSMPDWFKRLPAIDNSVVSATNNGLTVKRCMPVLDTMTPGFVPPI